MAAKKKAAKAGKKKAAKAAKGSAAKKKAARRAGGVAGPPAMARSRRGAARKAAPTVRTWLLRTLAVGSFLAGLWISSWVLALDDIVIARFEGRTFDVPSKVYAASVVLYPGMDWQRVDLSGWLARLGYRERTGQGALQPGRYEWLPGELRVHLRAFDHPQRPEPSRNLGIRLADGVIQSIVDVRDDSFVDVLVLEPEPVSAFLGSDREQRDLVKVDELPPHLLNAIFAVEDRRFEQHHGIDPRRIVGALLVNLRAGRVRQGASTLTQQLVKNFFLTPDRTLERKVQEAVMALIVEARYSKREILQAYLNEIYLGQRGSTAVHGVGEASRLYFGKSAANLSVAESAVLAAIIQSPNGISPHRNPEGATKRRNLVLGLMHDQNFISGRALAAAKAEPLRVSDVRSERSEVRYFLDALSRQLPEVYDDRVLASRGLQIYSTLDPRMQRAAVAALRSGIERIESQTTAPPDGTGPLQGCLIALRPQTGEVLALVGGRSYGGSQFNRCTQARRQVGSVFKPVVYVAALDPANGPVVTLASRLEDAPFEVEVAGEEPWQPRNYDHEFRGPVSVREAVERSLNIPAARLGQKVGFDRITTTARALGITSPLPRVASLALGTAGISPIEIAQAYATLANGGRRPTVRTFVDVVDASGVATENRPLEGSSQAIDPATAYLAVSLLEGVVNRGTAAGVRTNGMKGPIAGKTGTTDDENDIWFVGFTPELVAVVWVGYDEPRAVGLPSSRGALPIWTDFARRVMGSTVRGAFQRPMGIESIEIDPRTGARALRGCPEHQSELFISGTEPSETCPASAQSSAPGGQGGLFRRTLRRLFGEES